MTYGAVEYAGGPFAAPRAPEAADDTATHLSIEVAFTTGALETPAWEDITADVRSWDVQRGRWRELERFQPGRATIVLGNLSRQYDAVYAAGPHFGDLRPMRRVRIRETFNGVTYPAFDGFVDRWQLDYPAVGKDATATLTATDAFKIFARTDLPPSVYYDTVLADAPDLWWRFDDPQALFSAVDASGNGNHGTPEGGVVFEDPTLIVRDPGAGLRIPVAGNTNVEKTYSLAAAGVFSFEFWVKLDVQTTGARLVHFTSAGSAFVTFSISTSNFRGTFQWQNDAAGAFSAQPNFTFVQGQIYHIVCVHDAARLLHVYINGVENAYITQDTTTGTATITAIAIGSSDSTVTAGCIADEFAFYESAMSLATAAAHYAAGTAPWQGDDADDRLGRVLDEAVWPDDLRELDDGATTFQSAEIADQTVLEHAQKCAETEFGLLFVDRTGKVRFISRASQAARSAGPTVYGDGTGEVGYRSIRPDDGDEVIRNSVTISRLNGVARTATGPASIDEFGRFQYTLDGLLHDSDAYSATYAQFIVDEYENPRRRIVELTIGPPPDGEEDLFYPAMLGPELGDAISVTHTPQGLGSAFSQVCVVEGISHSSAPGRNRTTTFILSPEFTETLF